MSRIPLETLFKYMPVLYDLEFHLRSIFQNWGFPADDLNHEQILGFAKPLKSPDDRYFIIASYRLTGLIRYRYWGESSVPNVWELNFETNYRQVAYLELKLHHPQDLKLHENVYDSEQMPEIWKAADLWHHKIYDLAQPHWDYAAFDK